MNAVIVGCGRVGLELATTLLNDGHNVSVIDNDQKALDAVAEDLDILTLYGNGADINILKQAGVDTADIFIAVSTSDELNLLTCLMAKQISKCETIARVRNPLYSKETDFIKEKLGLSKIINPEYLAAKEIYDLLRFPALNRVDPLDDGEIIICTMTVGENWPLRGKTLMEMRMAPDSAKVLICAASRGEETIIPTGKFVIKAGDEITMVAERSEVRRFLASQDINNKPAENVLISGGGIIAYYLTEMLLSKKGSRVRVVEQKEDACLLFSERFPNAEIIRGDGTDRQFLQKHGLSNADAFVPLMGVDEENLIISTYAKNATKAKIITKVTRTDMNDLIDTLAIDSVVFPKILCSDIIAQYVRAKSSGAGGSVETLFRYLDNRIEIIEFKAAMDKDLCYIPFMEMNLKKDLIIAGLIRKKQFIVPSGINMIKEGDSVIIVTKHKGIKTLHDILR